MSIQPQGKTTEKLCIWPAKRYYRSIQFEIENKAKKEAFLHDFAKLSTSYAHNSFNMIPRFLGTINTR